MKLNEHNEKTYIRKEVSRHDYRTIKEKAK